jgi:hypothetical protein
MTEIKRLAGLSLLALLLIGCAGQYPYAYQGGTIPLISQLPWDQVFLDNTIPAEVTPQWTPISGVQGVEYAPNTMTDLYSNGQSYYYNNQGQWYQGEHPQGPWRRINRAPPSFHRVRASYSKHPPGWAKGKKTGWGGASMPPGQMKKYQKSADPRRRPHRQVGQRYRVSRPVGTRQIGPRHSRPGHVVSSHRGQRQVASSHRGQGHVASNPRGQGQVIPGQRKEHR